MEVITKMATELVQVEEILVSIIQEIPTTTLETKTTTITTTTTTTEGVVMAMLTEMVEQMATTQQAQVDHLQMVETVMILVGLPGDLLAQVDQGGQILLDLVVLEGMDLVVLEGMDLALFIQQFLG